MLRGSIQSTTRLQEFTDMIRPLIHLSHLAIAAALLAVAPVWPAWGQATGSAGVAPAPACALSSTDTDPLTAVRDLQWQGHKGVARACWVGGQGRQGKQVVLELQVEGQPLQRHSIPAGQSLEGSLDELRFDNARFALSDPPERGLTLALRLSTRNRGAQMDDRFVYLWLYQFDGRQLQHVFDMTVDERSDFRDCGNDCAPATLSHSVLIVQPGPGHHGLRDLRQRQKSWTEGPDGKPLGGMPPWSDQIYFFDGVRYQRQP